MNEALFVLTLIINFAGILAAYKFLGKTGLYSWIAFATVLANIEVVKSVDIFSLSLTLGNVLYGTTFLVTDILSEIYGRKAAQKAVWVGFFAMILFTVISQINLLFVPNANDFASDAMKTLFGLTPRLCLGSLTAYFISNMLDTYTFEWLKKKFKWLWLRNNLSTMTSQLIDSVIFTLIAFWGVFPGSMLIELALTTYAIKVLIAACDTPFIYIARKMGVQNG